jgi:PAS domain S-box-containing protein
VPGIVWETVIDPTTKERKTTFISDYLRRMLGYRPQEWLATSPGFGLKIMAEEDRERVARESEAVIASGKEGVTQFRWRRKDGQMVWTESHLSPISDGKQNVIGLRGVTLDITQRKLAEEALKKAEEKARAILNAIPDLMFLQTREGVYLDHHTKDPKNLLAPANEFLGKNMREVLPAELADQFAVCFERAVDLDEPQILEYKLPINGTERSYEARIVRSGENILTVVRDITERKLAIDELRQSEERFSKAFRANPQPMSLTTMANGRYVDVNESFLTVSGYTREEVIGRTSLELRIWETPESRADFVGKLKTYGSLVNIETKFRTKSGDLRVLLSSAEKLDIDGEQCLLVASSDITERMAAQQALQESEARFRNMADTAPVLIWISGAAKWCTYFNQQWLDFTGRTMEQELGNGWADGVHPDDYEQCLETYVNAFDRREPFRMEYRLRAADGSFRWMIDSGTPRFSATREFLGYIGSCVDISDRKQSEEALVTAHHELVIAHEEVNRLKNQLEAENIYLQQELQLDQTFGEMVGQSDGLKYVQFKISQVALTDSTVLITGETGTGKELVARAIHGASLRKDRPLIKVNCAALPSSLIESELFGYEKGAFTGATSRRLGRFELANGGTIFLDEIGDLPLESQVKLLRTIQEGEIERVGGTRTITIDVRIIAATNRNLKQEIEKGSFREDLWYRLNVFPITVPPLRHRKDDIPPLTDYFIRKSARKLGKKIDSVSASAMRTLKEHSWPGNIRELENVIERAVIYCQGSVLHLSERFDTSAATAASKTKSLEEIERDYIIHILESTRGRIEGPNGAAKLLGLNPSTLRTRMTKLGIQKPPLSAAR